MENGAEPEGPVGAFAVTGIMGDEFEGGGLFEVDCERVVVASANDGRAVDFASIGFDDEDAASFSIFG